MNNRILLAIDVAMRVLCSLLLVAMSALLILQVVLRYAFNAPLFWIEEVCTYLLVSVTFLGAAFAWGRREHITVDFAFEMLPARYVGHLRYFVDASVMAFCIWAVQQSYEYVLFAWAKKSFTTGLPMGLGYVAVPIAFGAIAVQCATFIYMRLREIPEVVHNDVALD